VPLEVLSSIKERTVDQGQQAPIKVCHRGIAGKKEHQITGAAKEEPLSLYPLSGKKRSKCGRSGKELPGRSAAII